MASEPRQLTIIVGIVGVVGAAVGGLGATLTRGQSEGQLAKQVEVNTQDIAALKAVTEQNRAFREAVLQHMSKQDERWVSIERFIYRKSNNEGYNP